jgi:hypothetical protein
MALFQIKWLRAPSQKTAWGALSTKFEKGQK